MDMLPQPAMNKWQALEFVWDVLMLVAIPVIIFTLLGKWLDVRWHTFPWMTTVGLFVSLPLSFYGILRKVRSYRPPNNISNDQHSSGR